MSLPPLIWDEFHAEHVSPDGMDALWAQSWRHFGTHFFRYSVMEQRGSIQTVAPLRVELSQFEPTKSQRRILRKNADVATEIGAAQVSNEVRSLFDRHRTRFTENVPEDVGVFLSADPAQIPCECLQVRCLLEGHCIATSFFDKGAQSISSVYAVFEPEHASRSLGIFTLLQEIFWAREQGMRFAYPGYATLGPSHYDYKKQFSGLQGFDWNSQAWVPWSEMAAMLQQGT
jgi:arginine-tRNA-protein transferase